jgi:2-dehydropantoate 2-reductase
LKICVFGAGAIGGYMAVELERAGYDVSIVARGPHLEAIRSNGLRLRIGDEERSANLKASDDPADLGPQDYVIITLKAHSVPPIADKLKPLLGEDTAIVTGMNGIPYWYFYGQESPWRDRRIESVDPGGVLWNSFTPERAIGCVVYPACEVVEPGVIQHLEGNRFTLGEPDGSKSDRVQALSRALIDAGLRAPVRNNIRNEIWIKLWGNLSFNPISALTGSTLEDIVADPDTRALARTMMLEAQAIALKLGVKFPINVDKRIEGAGAVGAHKTSMLQDLERGRPMEIDALVSSVQELGALTQTPTPAIDTVLALTKRLARQSGCYG